jgi:hypothetical protein
MNENKESLIKGTQLMDDLNFALEEYVGSGKVKEKL